MTYFFDSSALKLFVQESGTATALQLYEHTGTNTASVLVSLEVRSAVRRREQNGDLAAEEADAILRQLELELDHLELVAVAPDLLMSANGLIDHNRLRALDAIQLASAKQVALSAEPFVFVCSDVRLLQAASSEGLSTLNPVIPGVQ